MDMNWSTIWSVYTVLMLTVFVGVSVWAWSGKRKQAFSAAANLPFADDPPRSDIAPAQAKESDHE